MATNGLVVMTPTSVAKTGASSTATINADGSVTFGSCETLSLNGVFTGDYDNYMMAISCVNTTSQSDIYFRWRASGTDEASASNYYTSQNVVASGTSIAASRVSESQARCFAAGTTTYDTAAANVYLFGPYLSQPSASRAIASSSYSSVNPRLIYEFATTHSLSNQYDGLTIYPSGNAFTGLLTVFGFNQ